MKENASAETARIGPPVPFTQRPYHFRHRRLLKPSIQRKRMNDSGISAKRPMIV
jgi:hypothetical protein